MAFNPNPEQAKTLLEYDVSYNFTMLMPDAPKNMTEEQENKYRPKAGKLFCHITDRATKQVYISESGDDQETAFQKAFAKVLVTDKPKTRAQELIAKNATGVDPRDAELARLRAENSMLKSGGTSVSVSAPKRKGGRPRKNPLPVQAPADTSALAAAS